MIRLKYSDSNGVCKCYTCGDSKSYKEQQCGHYISRRYLSTRFFEKNTKPQCVKCNIFQEGNKPKYTLHLIKEYGRGVLDELDQLSHIQVKYTRDKLSSMIDHYKREIEKTREKL